MSNHRAPLKIGITCYPTYGGSGVIATEIGMALAERGHIVHFISYAIPYRLNQFKENIFFHEVETLEYPVFQYPPYSLSLASKMVEVASYEGLDVLHVHYAIPHAASAFLAKQILKQRAPKVITTLHGTDITLVGKEPSYLPITRFSIVESDGITAPSRYLRHATYDQLNIDHAVPIEIISNFVDTETFSPPKNTDRSQLKPLLGRCTATNKIITHVSNFRPVKRILDVIKIFEIVSRTISAHLILVGDGPERSQAENLVRELKLTERVCFIGKQDSFTPILQNSDLFLLPSESESFGLAALEAMSCGVPVVASNAGGLPEVITQGKEGFLAPIGDVEGMAKFATDILTNPKLLTELSNNARTRAVTEFSKDALISKYEDYYYKILGQ